MTVERPEKSGRGGPIRRGFRSLFGSPAGAAGIPQIRENWRAIRGMAALIIQGPQADDRVRVKADRVLDLHEMAYVMGTTISVVEMRLSARRRQTRLAVYAYLGAAVVLWASWLYEAIASPGSYARLLTVAGLIAITTCFGLGAFYNALVNWQIRAGRLGSAGEFMSTTDSWRPS